MSGKTTEMFSL